jgi:RHH-type proline utilization regulon transcriptional repressor/proline dehydrogenase/delta 1-pyrroline-5-carboxylate dehydrogenase
MRAQRLIAGVRGLSLPRDELAAKSVELATLLLELARALRTPAEQRRAARLARLLDDPQALAFGQALTDRAARPHSPTQIVHAAQQVLRRHGIPSSLPILDRATLRALGALGGLWPRLTAPALTARIRRETASYLIPSKPGAFAEHLIRASQDGLQINVNLLGEEVLSEVDAEHHRTAYLELLSRPEVTTISVKISAIFSRINVLAWDQTLALLKDALRPIYRAANGTPQKLVYLDMESHRDLALNLQLFQSLLDEPELLPLSAGVVLQAYIPESASFQRQLVDWATRRVQRGGAPIRLRVAKGANLGMERVDSSLRGWPSPTFASKHEVDANYKRMIEFGTLPQHANAVHLGIASHNLFDIAYGALLRASRQTEASVGFELLQGMADPFCRALQQAVGNVLLYAPTVSEHEFASSIAYLVRRLDENSSPENFLRHGFELDVRSEAFDRERQKFLLSCLAVEHVADQPKRNQDRRDEAQISDLSAPFRNEPDTDFSRPCNRDWIQAALSRQQSQTFDLPLCVHEELRFDEPAVAGIDPSRPGHVPYRYRLATESDIAHVIEVAEQGHAQWSRYSSHDRATALLTVAAGLRRQRGDLIASMVLDAGKRVEEADVEVSEAIDFAEYYARSWLELQRHVHCESRGIAVVTPPWNFPLAIPLGGTLAALVAGNSVILKPAPETVLVADRAAHVLWDAGIPREALQLVTAEDAVASRLITNPRVASVILTGATSTALLFRSLRPRLHLCAETGGKNAMIVTSFADRELAIRDTLSSAFGHAGQKCSAASLLILEASLYDDATFLERLRDAAADLVVGSAWDLTSFVTPLIRAAEGPLQQALTTLDPDESWLLEPKVSASNALAWRPGIKLGVREGSFSHTTECFGPVLAVLRAEDLPHALHLANATSYGLTAGLHSLDDDEQRYFLEHMNAGNLYVNRTLTGAIVGRQPFGGRKASSVGPGLKAGGPNYLLQLMREVPGEPTATASSLESVLPDAIASSLKQLSPGLTDAEQALLQQRARDYQQAYERFFAVPQDTFQLLGQDNWLVYQPWPALLRVDSGASLLDLASVVVAAQIASAPLHLSVADEVTLLPSHPLFTSSSRAPSNLKQLPDYLAAHGIDRVRALGSTPDQLFLVTAATTSHVAHDPVSAHGRIELLHHLREQSRSITTHRYGHLGHSELSRQKPTNR